MESKSIDFDRKLFLYGVGVALIAGLVTFTFPYQGKSIAEIFVPVIKYGRTRIYLSGLIPLGLVIWSSHLIVNSGRFKNRLLVAVFILFLVMPSLDKVFDLMISPVYSMSSGARAVELKEADLSIYVENMDMVVAFNAEVKSYVDGETDVRIYVGLPEVMHHMVVDERVLVYETNGLDKGRNFSIDYEGDVELSDGYDYEDFLDLNCYDEDYMIIVDDGVNRYEMTFNDGLF